MGAGCHATEKNSAFGVLRGVFSHLRKEEMAGFSPVSLGAEQKYIGSTGSITWRAFCSASQLGEMLRRFG